MNAEALLNHFDRISEAPEAVARLRRFILDLAVRGKLVAQDPNDEPAAELLKRIQAEKKRLVKEGTIKKTAIISVLQGCSEAPFGLPPSWVWGCLGDVAQYGLPGKVDSNKDIAVDTWVLDLEDIEKDTSRLIEHIPSSARPFRSTKTVFKRGDVLFGKLRPYLNKVLVADQDGVCTTEIIPIRGYCGLNPEYMKLVLKSPLTMAQVDRLMYGMKMPRLGTGDAVALSFPLSPLAEQHRIVAKVDELMALCDQLQAARDEREARRDRLVAASLHRIGAAAVSSPLPPEVSEEKPRLREGLGVRAEQAGNHSPLTPALSRRERGEKQEDPSRMGEAEQQAWRQAARFHLDHLPRLTTRPAHIKQLRQTILNLAVRGRLVLQDPNDEPAAELLGSRRFFPDLEPWKMPIGWAWSSFGLIGRTLGGGTPSKADPEFWNGTIPWVSPKDMKVDVIEDTQDHISEAAVKNSAARLIPTGSLLMVVRGMILAHSFPTAKTAVPITINQDMKAIVPFRPGLINFLLLLTKGLKLEVLRFVLRSTHGTCRLLTDDLFCLPISIPPLAEQQRIVAKVDELMALCDQLEQQLVTTETDSRLLLEAVLRDALAPALEDAA